MIHPGRLSGYAGARAYHPDCQGIGNQLHAKSSPGFRTMPRNSGNEAQNSKSTNQPQMPSPASNLPAMTEQTETASSLTSLPADVPSSVVEQVGESVLNPSDPKRSEIPILRGAEVAAVYHNLRVAGDFYEFLRVGPTRVLFGCSTSPAGGRYATHSGCRAECFSNPGARIVCRERN